MEISLDILIGGFLVGLVVLIGIMYLLLAGKKKGKAKPKEDKVEEKPIAQVYGYPTEDSKPVNPIVENPLPIKLEPVKVTDFETY